MKNYQKMEKPEHEEPKTNHITFCLAKCLSSIDFCQVEWYDPFGTKILNELSARLDCPGKTHNLPGFSLTKSASRYIISGRYAASHG
jgi:hypothetical protein